MWRIDQFLGNNRETNKRTSVARLQILNKQQLNYNNRETVGNGVSYAVHAKRLYNEDTSRVSWRKRGTHVEAESKTSSVTLRVVGGDEKGTQC
jgi:hypothetical protein